MGYEKCKDICTLPEARYAPTRGHACTCKWLTLTVVRLMKPTAVGFIRYGRRRSDRIGTARFVWKVGHLQSWFFCIHRDFDVRNNVYKPRRLVCECCRDISAWKSRVMKPTVLGIRVGWSQLSTGMKPTDSRTADNSAALKSALETDYACNGWIWAIGTCKHKFSDQLGLHLWVCRQIYR